jgi:phenylpyruvate tautomerase
MPLLKLETSRPVAEDKKEKLILTLSRLLSDITGKPESYAMITLNTLSAGSIGGKATHIAFADVRGIGGFNPKVNNALTKAVCDLMKKELNIDEGNTYITFTDVPATNWGWKGSTFG